MNRSRFTALLGTSFVFVMFTFLQLFQYHLRTFIGLPFSKALFGYSFFIFASFGIGFATALLYGWLRKKGHTLWLLVLSVFLLIEAATVWLFFILAASQLDVPASWMLFLVSLFIPTSGAAGYLSIALSKFADIKMADAKAAAVIKPLSVAFSVVFFVVAATVGILIWMAE